MMKHLANTIVMFFAGMGCMAAGHFWFNDSLIISGLILLLLVFCQMKVEAKE